METKKVKITETAESKLSESSSEANLANASTKAMTKHDTLLTTPRDLEKNQEVLALLACLNEQAVKEIN
jgi:hypothetical protein